MKVLIFIGSLLAVAVAQDPSLSCNYYYSGEIYECELSIQNPNGFDNFTEIGGTHLEGFTDADVSWIIRGNGITPIIPQIICETFPNIIEMDLYRAELTEIDSTALSGCSQIRRLHLHFNQISSISANAFANLLQIERLSLRFNLLTSLPGNVFANLSEIQHIDLSDNLLTSLPENIFESQRHLTSLYMNYNSFNNFSGGVFRPLESLEFLNVAYNSLDAVNNEWFATNSKLNYLGLVGNRINLTSDSFANLQPSLRNLNLNYNEISEIPTGSFAGLVNLTGLQLRGNLIREIRENTFVNLGQLRDLEIGLNPIERIDSGAFRGLDSSLTWLSLSNSRIRDLSSISFENLGNLTSIDLNFNEIEDIPAGTFVPMPNLNYIGLRTNRLKTLRRNGLGTLTELETLDLGGNIMNALDRAIIDDAVNLNILHFTVNLCANHNFVNFLINRPTYLSMLEVCFRNMRFIVDTTTESDGIYSFFDGPHLGIVLRVRSDNEIQIALAPFNFLWTPSIEIFIGATNNTRSVIRINEETSVVTVPTPNIIQHNQWNDFRITWANQNVLVFRGNETFPFMSYTMQHFFPVNFYGLRAVETRASWSVTPHDD